MTKNAVKLLAGGLAAAQLLSGAVAVLAGPADEVVTRETAESTVQAEAKSRSEGSGDIGRSGESGRKATPGDAEKRATPGDAKRKPRRPEPDNSQSVISPEEVFLLVRDGKTSVVVMPADSDILYGLLDENGNHVPNHRNWKSPANDMVVFQNVKPGRYTLEVIAGVAVSDAGNAAVWKMPGAFTFDVPGPDGDPFDPDDPDDDPPFVNPQDTIRSADGRTFTIMDTSPDQEYALFLDGTDKPATDWLRGNGTSLIFRDLDRFLDYEPATRRYHGEDPFKPTIVIIHTLPLPGALVANIYFDSKTGGSVLQVNAKAGYGYALLDEKGEQISWDKLHLWGVYVLDSGNIEVLPNKRDFFVPELDGWIRFFVPAGGSFRIGAALPGAASMYDKTGTYYAEAVHFNKTFISGWLKRFQLIIAPAYPYSEYALYNLTKKEMEEPWERPTNGEVWFQGMDFNDTYRVLARPISEDANRAVNDYEPKTGVDIRKEEIPKATPGDAERGKATPSDARRDKATPGGAQRGGAE